MTLPWKDGAIAFRISFLGEGGAVSVDTYDHEIRELL
jgi:hypothetical protein